MSYSTLIDGDTLQQHLNDDDWCIVDCRFTLGKPNDGYEAFKTGHIPRARYADLEVHMSGTIVPGTTGRHPLPNRKQFARTIELLGIYNHQQIVAYDAGPGMYAARFWWMLRWLGHSRVAVLDQGIKGWQAAGFGLSDEPQPVLPGKFEMADSLTKNILSHDIPGHPAQLLDARDPVRFRGEQEPIDTVAGHIPGAQCLPFNNNLNSDGGFKTATELAAQFESAGIGKEDSLICYCGSGVTAAHNILALVHSGYPEPGLYAGSWSEWITDPDRPVETS